ncbi:hypothetical protein DIPPA_10086 [Diplonema papillatum]|nr:hypothetical protein DIPPA_10086 [Diplonema papillatum]
MGTHETVASLCEAPSSEVGPDDDAFREPSAKRTPLWKRLTSDPSFRSFVSRRVPLECHACFDNSSDPSKQPSPRTRPLRRAPEHAGRHRDC